MDDQVATLEELGVPAAALNSTLSPSSSGDGRAPARGE
jgi:superfamily II DNA helicase RecQ